MNISLPNSLKAFVDEQVGQRGYGTGSEYVRELIRRPGSHALASCCWKAALPSPAARPMKPTSTACVAASVNVLKGEA